jgi:hypothetical protein
MKTYFELELLYSYTYVLSPCPRVPVVSQYAQKLVFEYCIRYADILLRSMSDSSYAPPLTFYDAMRVYMIGQQFLELLQHRKELLEVHSPVVPDTKQGTPRAHSILSIGLPPGETVLHFNTVRSITCIKQITECLSRFGIRWGYMRQVQQILTKAVNMRIVMNIARPIWSLCHLTSDWTSPEAPNPFKTTAVARGHC